MPDFVYQIGDRLYLNITNRCTNSCDFCIKTHCQIFEGMYDLWLDEEPTVPEVLLKVPDPAHYSEIVFCGYGEPLLRLEPVKEISQELKKRGGRVRIDTDGLANLYYGRNILPELHGLVDAINVSMNAPDSPTYFRHCRPSMGPDPYGAILQFIDQAKKWIPEVTASIVELPDIDIAACMRRTAELGVPLIIRPYYADMYIEKRRAA